MKGACVKPATVSTRRWLARLGIVASVSTWIGLGIACSASDDDLPNKGGHVPATTSASGSSSGAGGGPCTDGESEACHITIGNHDGVLTCLDGTHTCIDGNWSPCTGTFSEHPAPGGMDEGSPSPDPKPLSLSDAGPCMNNPCDPTCQIFNEVPDGGVTIPPTSVQSTYQAGDIGSIPPAFIGNGINEPCGTAADCQFDEVCTLPASGTCPHSKCSTGLLLDATCDPCVGSICAADPTCCTSAPGTCTHDTCVQGDSLVSGCDPCVTSICATDTSCCGLGYNTPACAHQSCAPGAGLDATCDSCVGTICATNPGCCIPTFDPSCAHDACTLGSALAGGCDACVAGVCAQNQGCCGVASTFGATCKHSPCVQGKELKPSCDPCVAAICADPVYASCCTNSPTSWTLACVNAVNLKCAPKSCNTTWTQTCVDEIATTGACGGKTCTPTWTQACVDDVASVCGKTCSGFWDATCVDEVNTICGQTCNTWSAGCVDKVDSVCGALCKPANDPNAACVHNPCLDGPPLAAGCSACVAQICGTYPSCCTTDWDATCKAAVGTICGQTCQQGDCAPWVAGATDPGCPGVDLTAGVPCTGFVPICNRGATDVPAGVKVFIYPAGSAEFLSCAPTAGAEVAQCTVATAITAGSCVNITNADCTAALVGGELVMVNPPAGSGNAAAVAECHCENDWSDYHSGGCSTVSVATYGSSIYKQQYTPTCPTGTVVQWGFFAYETTTPGDSSIVMEVHSADTVADLAGPLLPVATARLSPNTQICPMAGPAPCPYDLFSILGFADSHRNVLEVVFTLNATSNGLTVPTLNDWQVTYSCIDSE